MMSTMQSFIVTTKDAQKGKDYALQFCKEKNISTFDLVYVDLEKLSIGITDIKQMQKNLYQKPFNSAHKAIIISDADTLTIEAQNALLKTLEEPPAHALIFLVAPNKESFLPTVLSRCKVISLDVNQEDKTSLEQYIIVLEELPHYSIGQKLKLAQDQSKTKDSALSWLKHMILAIRQQLVNQKYNNSVQLLRLFQKTHTIIETTNVAPRLAIENLLLQLS